MEDKRIEYEEMIGILCGLRLDLNAQEEQLNFITQDLIKHRVIEFDLKEFTKYRLHNRLRKLEEITEFLNRFVKYSLKKSKTPPLPPKYIYSNIIKEGNEQQSESKDEPK